VKAAEGACGARPGGRQPYPMAWVGPVQVATVAAPSLAHGQGSLPLKVSKKLLVPWMRRPPGHFASGARRGLPWVIHKSLLLGFSLVILPALGPV